MFVAKKHCERGYHSVTLLYNWSVDVTPENPLKWYNFTLEDEVMPVSEVVFSHLMFHLYLKIKLMNILFQGLDQGALEK